MAVHDALFILEHALLHEGRTLVLFITLLLLLLEFFGSLHPHQNAVQSFHILVAL